MFRQSGERQFQHIDAQLRRQLLVRFVDAPAAFRSEQQRCFVVGGERIRPSGERRHGNDCDQQKVRRRSGGDELEREREWVREI